MWWMDLLELLPIFVPVAIGLASAVFGQFLLTSRKLRNELAVDSEMLERLPDDARQELTEEVRRRTYLLVAYTRYPVLTRPEFLALLAVLLITAIGVALVWGEERVDPDSSQSPLIVNGFLALLTFASWIFYLHSWVPRALDRVAYILRRLSGEHAQESVRLLRVTVWVTMSGVLACLLTPPVVMLFVADVYELDDAARTAAIASVVALGVAFIGVTVWRSQAVVNGTVSELLLRLLNRERSRSPSPETDQDRGPETDQLPP
jgi:hypothetical protein